MSIALLAKAHVAMKLKLRIHGLPAEKMKGVRGGWAHRGRPFRGLATVLPLQLPVVRQPGHSVQNKPVHKRVHDGDDKVLEKCEQGMKIQKFGLGCCCDPPLPGYAAESAFAERPGPYLTLSFVGVPRRRLSRVVGKGKKRKSCAPLYVPLSNSFKLYDILSSL